MARLASLLLTTLLLMAHFALEGKVRNATLVADWDTKTPAGASMRVWIEDEASREPGAASVAEAVGAGPLTVEIPGAAFGELRELRAGGNPEPGAAADYDIRFTLWITYA